YRFPPEVISRLLRTEWWNLPLQYLLSIDFSDIEKALSQLETAPQASGSHVSFSRNTGTSAVHQLPASKHMSMEDPADPQDDAFFRFLSFKMEERGIPAHIIEFLRKSRRSLFDKYNLLNIEELAIINNKIQYVADKFS